MTAAADRYRRLAEHFDTVVRAVPTDRWDSPSPCKEWKAVDIVAHVADTEVDFLRRMGFTDSLPDTLPESPVDRWKIVRPAVQEVLDDPSRTDHAYDGYFGPTTFGKTADQFYSMDLCVHAWDLARATGLTHLEPIDPTEMVAIHAAMDGLGDNLRQPGLIDAEVEVPNHADEQTKFLAWLGRRA
jgi:uncharacterized protein (TIGR03086 family)